MALEGSRKRVAVPRGISRAAIKLGMDPSPGSMQGCRIAMKVRSGGAPICDAFIASAAEHFHVQVPLDGGGPQEGKDKLLVPTEAQGAVTHRLALPRPDSEIQAVALAEADGARPQSPVLLGSVDAFGRVMVAEVAAAAAASDGSVAVAPKWRAAPPDSGAGEGGWAGLALMPGEPSWVATARSFAKQVDLYDTDRHVRAFPLWHQPSAILFLPTADGASGPSSAFVVTEGSQVSVWDVRVAERGGCVQRLQGGTAGAPLYAAACAPGLLGVAGGERSLLVFDTRRWAIRSRWTGCVKYEIMGLAFSSIDPSMVYINGLDYEVVCGRWDKEGTRGAAGRLFAFRGDSRWCGVAKAAGTDSGSDVIGGWSQSGNIFIADICEGEDSKPGQPL